MAKGTLEIEADAKKILGNDAKIPSVDKYVERPSGERGKAGEAFTKSVNDLDTSLSAYMDSCTALGNALERYINILSKDDVGLDGKNADQNKKIVQARKLLVGYYTDAQKNIANDVKSLDALDKQLAQFAKFKPSLFW